ncbi:MAG: ABC transporter ATP-binding protein [Caldisericaceae bacterium]
MRKTVLEAKNITKHFPGVVANDHVNFDLYEGEVHTLLGENGAGKTTLMNVLDGLYYPNEGDIYIDGKKADINSPVDSMKLGIGMIHQHFMLVDTLTVAENIVLGFQRQGFVVDSKKIAKSISDISERYNLQISPFSKIWQLSVGEQQRAEIIKMLYRGAKILILDEPTAVLTPKEIDSLFSIINKIRSDGKSIVFISHKLEEVLNISDRITVLKKGKVVGTVNRSETNEHELAQMMVGREVLFRFDIKQIENRKEVLRVEKLESYNNRGIKTVNGLSFSVNSGEVFGIAGVAGNGQEELAEVITGLRKAYSGRLFLNGADITNHSPSRIIALKVNYIPADRLRTGLVPTLSSVENAILRCYKRRPVGTKGLIDFRQAQEYTNRLVEEFNIVVPRIDAPVKLLSGGNMQKLLLAREIKEDPVLLIAVHPTRGLDIGSTEFVRKKLLEARDNGAAVLLISEDLDELLMISDRIGVMYGGKMTGIFEGKNANIDEIGLLMGGSKSTENAKGASYA